MVVVSEPVYQKDQLQLCLKWKLYIFRFQMYPLTINHWKVEVKLGVGPVFDKPLVLPEDMDILVELYVKVALIKHVYDAITLTRHKF